MQRNSSGAPTGTSTAPEWVQEAVFYQIFPDRFARSERVPKPSNLEPWGSPPTARGFQGGDLIGICEHLDYLQDLGISALYLNPVFQSTANHRYHTHDYREVDPILGGNGALRVLLTNAHDLGIRVILDGVFNHASRSFLQFADLLENGNQSPYLDWFHVRSWPLRAYDLSEPPGYECWWGNRELPKFNTDTPAVRDFLWGVGQWWIEQGIDGWRLDVPNEIEDDAFWQEFRLRVKAARSDAYLVGEIWGDANRWLQGDQFDAVMNYLFTRACIGFFAGSGRGIDNSVIAGTGLDPIPPLDAEGFRAAIESLLATYPWWATLAQLNLLGSHDTPRFRTIARDDDTAFRLATLFQMTFPGAPCVYYGDEIGMTGGHDPDNRRAFPWEHRSWDHELRTYVRRCVQRRHAHPVLRRGGFTTRLCDDGVFVFERRLGDDIALVALNAGHAARTVDLIGLHLDPYSVIDDCDCRVPAIVEGDVRGWQIAARSGTVLFGTVAPA